jgi:hypothetical protein
MESGGNDLMRNLLVLYAVLLVFGLSGYLN